MTWCICNKFLGVEHQCVDFVSFLLNTLRGSHLFNILVFAGIPLVVVVTVISVDKDNYGLVTYGKYNNGSSDDL